MANICRHCGTMNPDSSDYCGRCGNKLDPLSNLNGTVQINKNDSDRGVSGNKKTKSKTLPVFIGLVVVLVVVVLIVLIHFAFGKPNEEWLKNNLIGFVPQYEYDGNIIQDATKVSILNEDSGFGRVDFQVEVVQEDSRIQLKHNMKVSCSKSLFGGWGIDSAHEFEECDISAKEEFVKERGNSFLGGYGFSDYDFSGVDYTGNNTSEVVYDVNQNYRLVSLKGSISYCLKLYEINGKIEETESFKADQCKLKWKMKEICDVWVSGYEDASLIYDVVLNVVKKGNHKLIVSYSDKAVNSPISWSSYSNDGKSTIELPENLDELFSMNKMVAKENMSISELKVWGDKTDDTYTSVSISPNEFWYKSYGSGTIDCSKEDE